MKMKIVFTYISKKTYIFQHNRNFNVNVTNALLAMTTKNQDKKFKIQMQTEQICFAAADKMCMVFSCA